MKKANVEQQLNGVKVTFSGAIEKQNVVSMVERCQTGQCDCMSSEAKKRLEGLEVSGKDGNVELHIKGDISAKDIEAAVSKSPLIKN